MIRLRPLKDHRTTVTFMLSSAPDVSHVSVVGDFNGWDPHALPMKRLKDGRFQASVRLPADQRFEFLYLASDGRHLLDDRCDTCPNPHGGENSVLHT
ncbi:MAG: isoamylase early set domain-containing protein [Trueperaceae bacterium]|nr:isoamylase early set domain-containing protein [Trueperaceae bacterium]